MFLSDERYNSTIRNSLRILLVGELQGGRIWSRGSEIECNPFYQLQRSRSTGAARVIRGNFCAPPTHVLGNLLRSTTQTFKGVWNPYTKAVKGLSFSNARDLKILLESCRYGWPSKRTMWHKLFMFRGSKELLSQKEGHPTPHMRQYNSSAKKPGRQIHLVSRVTEQKGRNWPAHLLLLNVKLRRNSSLSLRRKSSSAFKRPISDALSPV